MSVLTYFGVLMEAARGLNSRESAANIMSDAAPYLEKKYNADILSMMADVTYYNYYVTMGGYDEAKKYADKLMSYKSLGVEKFFSKYYAAAEIVMLTEGDKDKAARYSIRAGACAIGIRPWYGRHLRNYTADWGWRITPH